MHLRHGPATGAGSRNEHNLSATQAQKEEHARVPLAHGEQNRTEGSRTQTGSRAEEAFRQRRTLGDEGSNPPWSRVVSVHVQDGEAAGRRRGEVFLPVGAQSRDASACRLFRLCKDIQRGRKEPDQARDAGVVRRGAACARRRVREPAGGSHAPVRLPGRPSRRFREARRREDPG